MTIIDTHAHIEEIEDLGNALTRAHLAGVSDIMAMSVDLDSMKKVLAIAGRYQSDRALYQMPRIHTALGVHPGKVKPDTQQTAFDFMRSHINQACAIGETGLDY